jgi:hypothetical protein
MLRIIDHPDGLPQFLLGQNARCIRGGRLLKFRGSTFQVAPFAKFEAILDVQLTSIKTSLIEFDLILGVIGIGL